MGMVFTLVGGVAFLRRRENIEKDKKMELEI